MDAMWAWGAVGLILLAVEIATGTFYVLWFGVAALCVSLITWLLPALSSPIQVLLFAGLSLATLVVWKKCFKKADTHSRVGQSQGEEIGRVGTVTKTSGPSKNGVIRFTQGLMGSREWAAISDEPIEAGNNATVIAVEGNALRIQLKN